MRKVGVIGAGAWGTAIAQSLARNNLDVSLWARESEVVEDINNNRINSIFLPGIKLSDKIIATDSLSKVVDSEALMIVTPAQYVRRTLEAIKGFITHDYPVVICAKGIEQQTGMLMSQIAKETIPDAAIAIMTGPTFADEVAKGLPAAVTLACNDKDIMYQLSEGLSGKTFRIYGSEDIIGAQLGGAIKNVIAIASGVVYGKNMGESAKAALITRGLAEVGRLASAMGAKKETLMGMCGMGDLMLTCSSMKSRNFSLGVEIGQGRSLAEIMNDRKNKVTEGVYTAEALTVLAKKNAVEMPISRAVHSLVSEQMPVDEVIEQVLERDSGKPEYK